MFSTCPEIEDTFCPDCVSGSPGCVLEDNEKGMVDDNVYRGVRKKVIVLSCTSLAWSAWAVCSRAEIFLATWHLLFCTTP